MHQVAPGDPKNDVNQSGSHYAAVPQNPQTTQAYQQSHGFGHTYHPPPQYNTAPPPSSSPVSFGAGIHYSYLLLMALAFATVVQITKGGLFAHDVFQRPQFVYPAVTTTTNLRHPYDMNNGMMPGTMNNNPNMMNSNMYPSMMNGNMMNGNMMNGNMMNGNMMNGNMMNGNMMNGNMMNGNMMNGNMMNGNQNMMMNNQNMMMTAASMQQDQSSGTSATTVEQASTTGDVSTVAAPVEPASSTSAVVPEAAPVATETTAVVEEPLPPLVIEKDAPTPKSSGNGAALESLKLSELSNFKNTWEEWEPTDVPVFFHIPKAGGK